METEHIETVVDKGVAYVKDFFGVPTGDRTSHIVANPEYTDIAPKPTIQGAMRLDPYTFKSVAELHIEKSANDDSTKERASPAELHADGPMT